MKKDRKRRRWMVVSDPADSNPTSATTPTPAANDLDMNITTHGKIRAYVQFIAKTLSQAPKTSIHMYAKETAAGKLVTVLEILKRQNIEGLTHELQFGDTARSPCVRVAGKEDGQAQKRQKIDGEPWLLATLKVV
ncbi:hypothetical protein DL89DRAFT_268045 [Linderina pennispora]|uniref:DNA/RNA-binding protein Alba-like domain-containing protein n=1 Tax=Linderina pennispora TaxID=61395 RepID=A0A1Y1W6K3_9FUNG|nr:uncharacterized protein DL89DRAFT_268045 [Linderina pennispora]ORX69005.1 hypothetical protein DL89DRAFT_268045 [Linderina pennispora]